MGLEVKNLVFNYYRNPLCIKDANFSVGNNEKVLILGSSEMGKTTLLNLLSGFETSYFGQIKYNGVEIRKIADEEKNFSLLPSEPVFFEDKTIEQNFDYFCEINKTSKVDALSICKNLGIVADKKTKIKKLKIAEKRLLAMERSLLKKPEIVFLDSQLKQEKLQKQKTSQTDLVLQTAQEEKIKEEYEKFLNYNKIVFFVASDEDYKNHKNWFKSAKFNKILYIFDANLRFFDNLEEFEDSFYCMNIFKFLDEEYLFVKCHISREQKFYNLEIEERFFEFEKRFNPMLDKLNLELGAEEDAVISAKASFDFGALNSDSAITKYLTNGDIHIFSNIDGLRII